MHSHILQNKNNNNRGDWLRAKNKLWLEEAYRKKTREVKPILPITYYSSKLQQTNKFFEVWIKNACTIKLTQAISYSLFQYGSPFQVSLSPSKGFSLPIQKFHTSLKR